MRILTGIIVLVMSLGFPIYCRSHDSSATSFEIEEKVDEASCASIISLVLHNVTSVFASSNKSDDVSSIINLNPPFRYSNQTSGAITFRSAETISYQCSLDGLVYASCTSPFRYRNLSNGQHTFSIIATDYTGNSSTPVTYTWTINTGLAASSIILLPQTGQLRCYDSVGREISCAGTGQDGDIQAGVPLPDFRFTDNNDGTITDNLTGLVWLKNAYCFGSQTWDNALSSAKILADGLCGLSDGSRAGEWRLPSINELESLLDIQNIDPPLPTGHPFAGVNVEDTWSSSSYAYDASHAWYVWMYNGYVGRNWPKFVAYPVWPVRSSAFTAIAQPIRSGQTVCYDSAGTVMACAESGQDGELRPGATWPSPRFSDNSDGTQTDNLTGLIWSKDCNPAGTSMAWQPALDYITKLNATNWLGHADWRLPNRKELISLINCEEANSANWLAQQGFSNITEGVHWWSSSTFAESKECAWYVDICDGNVHGDGKSWFASYVWPVRGGYIPQKLTITKSGFGTVSRRSGTLNWEGDTAVVRIAPGNAVTLSARPESGFTFLGWSGACAGTGECKVIMDAATDVAAEFSVLPSASAPSSLMVLTKTTTEGKVRLVAGPSLTKGAVYTFEYSNDGGNSWAIGYTGESRKPEIILNAPGRYQFRASTSAKGFNASTSISGNATCIYKPNDIERSHSH